MRRGAKLGVGIAVLLVAAIVGSLAAMSMLRTDDGGSDTTKVTAPPGPDGPPVTEARAYLQAWSRQDWQTMASLVLAPPDDFADQHAAVFDDLVVTKATFEVGAVTIAASATTTAAVAATTAAGAAVPDDAPRATAPFHATLTLDGLGDWEYDGTLHLVWEVPPPAPTAPTAPSGTSTTAASTTTGATARTEPSPAAGRWLVEWSPATIHPELAPGFRLERTRSWATRAPILDGNGEVLAGAAERIEVGVEPRRIDSRDEVAAAVSKHLGVSRAQLDAALDAPGVRPDYFVPLATVTPQRWDQVREAVLPVPGIIFREVTVRDEPPAPFARHVLGRIGEVTAERLEELGAPYRVGDVVGFGGIEGAYEQRLAGTPMGEVRLVDPTGQIVGRLHEWPGTRPEPVQLTLDPDVQAAAEAALDGVGDPAALVAIDATTGQVRATVSRPVDGFDRALSGRYPPGSTFKIVTALAALGNGVTPDTPIPCPSSIEIGGKTFRNYESEALGTIPFSRAFTASCNTAFMRVADDAGPAKLQRAAEALGFNSGYHLGLDTFPGSFPEPADRTENAADAIGQGRVEASPVHMASVAAAIASGTWRPPVLVLQPGSTDEPDPVRLNQQRVATIRGFMVGVVQGGTGTAAQIPGRTIAGKTGTAQFDTANPGRTHAWFVGFEGNLAFAVVVEGGGVGGAVAAPIARDFLERIP